MCATPWTSNQSCIHMDEAWCKLFGAHGASRILEGITRRVLCPGRETSARGCTTRLTGKATPETPLCC